MRRLAIATLDQSQIRLDKLGYKVPSQSGDGVYLANLELGPYCTCPDFEKRSPASKHVYAVEALLQRGGLLASSGEEEPLGVRITKAWQAYNAAQVRAGELFATLMRELCDTLEQPPQTTGRISLLLSDKIYGMGLKVYSTVSTRRAMSGLRDAASSGRMRREPAFSTPIRYFERPEVTPVLRGLLQT